MKDARAAVERTILIHALLTSIGPAAGLAAAIVVIARGDVAPAQYAVAGGLLAATIAGIELGYHRYFAHGAFKTGRAFELLLGLLGSAAGQGSLIFWVGNHRLHHQHSDADGDPHSPRPLSPGFAAKLRGFVHAQMGWTFAPASLEALKKTADLTRSSAALFLNRFYYPIVVVGLLLPAAIGGLITSSWSGALHGFLIGGCARLVLCNQIYWFVVSLCHMFGMRPFPTHDRSGNLWWVSLLTYGAGLQNSHHAFPSAGHVGWLTRWWELDLGGLVLLALQRLGVVSGVRTPAPKDVSARLKSR